MKIGIIDDEPDNRAILEHFIRMHHQDIIIVGQATNVKTGIQLINEQCPDIVFLDIKMPDGTGFDLIQQLDKHRPEIIFYTAYDQFALKAIECSALAYILKPITQESIRHALAKADTKINDNQKLLQYKILQEQLSNHIEPNERFLISNSDGMHIVYYNQLICCIAHSNYTDIHLENSKRITVAKTLKEMEFILGKNTRFIRIHQSSIINIEKIRKISKTEYNLVVTMANNMELSVSRSKKEHFLELVSSDKPEKRPE